MKKIFLLLLVISSYSCFAAGGFQIVNVENVTKMPIKNTFQNALNLCISKGFTRDKFEIIETDSTIFLVGKVALDILPNGQANETQEVGCRGCDNNIVVLKKVKCFTDRF